MSSLVVSKVHTLVPTYLPMHSKTTCILGNCDFQASDTHLLSLSAFVNDYSEQPQSYNRPHFCCHRRNCVEFWIQTPSVTQSTRTSLHFG